VNALVRWLTQCRCSRLDVALVAVLVWLIATWPNSLAVQIALLAAVMIGIPTLSSLLGLLARRPSCCTCTPGGTVLHITEDCPEHGDVAL